MAEKLWNMLKLLPSISASRKNSLITGLARVDEKTDELILSLYHLPEPAEFLDGKSATYYAWFYDEEGKDPIKIGELQRKNGLTFGYRKKVTLAGDGLFITVEEKGREVKQPGMVVLASNPEIFYRELVKEEPVRKPAESIHKEVKMPEFVEVKPVERGEKLTPPREEEPVHTEPIKPTLTDIPTEIPKPTAVPVAAPVFAQIPIEEPVPVDEVKPIEEIPAITRDVRAAEPVSEVKPIEEIPAIIRDVRAEESVCEVNSREEIQAITRDVQTEKSVKKVTPIKEIPTITREMVDSEKQHRKPAEDVLMGVWQQEAEIPACEPMFAAQSQSARSAVKPTAPKAKNGDTKSEEFKKLLSDFYADLPGDEFMGIIKDRYNALKKEIDLKEYWEKVKHYIHVFWEETKLAELWEAIKKDLKYLADKIGLGHLWEKIGDLITDIIEFLDPREWLAKAKYWIHVVDEHLQEWYETAKKYVNAILSEVEPALLWERIKLWIEGLLEKMNIDEIIIWIQVKIRELSRMRMEDVKDELERLSRQFIDALKLPELKMAVIKVAIREKLGQVGGFFQKVKETASGQKPPHDPEQSGKLNPCSGIGDANPPIKNDVQHDPNYYAPAYPFANIYGGPEDTSNYSYATYGMMGNPYGMTHNPYTMNSPTYTTATNLAGMMENSYTPSDQVYKMSVASSATETNPASMMENLYTPSDQAYRMNGAAYAMTADPTGLMGNSYTMPVDPTGSTYMIAGYPYSMTWNPYAQVGGGVAEYGAGLTGNNSGLSASQMYENPHIFRATADSPVEMAYPTPIRSCPFVRTGYESLPLPCSQCRNAWQVKKDAMGDPRYLYDPGDDDYFFITPDGEMISRS